MNTSDTEFCPTGNFLQCGFLKADIAKRRRVHIRLELEVRLLLPLYPSLTVYLLQDYIFGVAQCLTRRLPAKYRVVDFMT